VRYFAKQSITPYEDRVDTHSAVHHGGTSGTVGLVASQQLPEFGL
jgi:hypothetical protein